MILSLVNDIRNRIEEMFEVSWSYRGKNICLDCIPQAYGPWHVYERVVSPGPEKKKLFLALLEQYGIAPADLAAKICAGRWTSHTAETLAEEWASDTSSFGPCVSIDEVIRYMLELVADQAFHRESPQ